MTTVGKKGSTRFTACNQMQMGPRSLHESSLYDGKYRFFWELMPAASPLLWLWWCVQVAWPCRYSGSGEALSFKSGVAVRHSCFFLTETLPCLPACLRVKRLLGLFHLSCGYVRGQSNRSVWSSEAFWKPFRYSAWVAVFQARCSELIQIDWTSFRDQWQHYFGCASSPGCVRINGKAIFCARGRPDLTSYKNGRIKLRWWSVQGHKKHQQPIWTPFSSIYSTLAPKVNYISMHLQAQLSQYHVRIFH